ncbi:hypothetical protein EDB85DRAFT_2063018, partial [Lactarius pseudohatsudake]
TPKTVRSRDIQGVTPKDTPSELRSLYNTAACVLVAKDPNVLAIPGFMDDYPNPADLTTFMRKYRTDAEDATFQVVQINSGGNDLSNPGMEANVNCSTHRPWHTRPPSSSTALAE